MFDLDMISYETGLQFDNEKEVMFFLLRTAEMLAVPANNYTKAQAKKIDDIWNILQCWEVE